MNRDTRIVAGCLATISLMILTSSFATTIAIAHGAPRMLRLVFRLLCHGIPRRCLMISGVPMPICARCFGIYGGFLVGIALFPIWVAIRHREPRRRRTTPSQGIGGSFASLRMTVLPNILLAICVAPLAVDGFTQLLGLRESTNPLRLATGLIAGTAFGLWVLVTVETRARQRLAAS